MSAREELVEAIRLELRKGSYQMPGESLPYEAQARAVAAALLAAGDWTPKPPTPVYKTREEMAAFAADWDAKVAAGRLPVGTEVKTRSGVYPSVPVVKQADGSWKPKYSYTETGFPPTPLHKNKVG